MNASERRAVSSLALVFGLRMLGLFLILPVMSIFARDMPGSTPALAGLALGVYGLTQAFLQIPFGFLSDRFGRKRLITIGLGIFILGSIVAALADTIYGVIAGRALQGAGAISAAVLALVADLTREQQRTKAMALFGGSIGLMFMLALVLGPMIEGWLGVSAIFWITAVLALGVIPVLWWWTPTPVRVKHHADVAFDSALFKRILRHPHLARLNMGIFSLHFALTSFFVVVPLSLVDTLGIATSDHWKLYMPVLALSVLGMVPMLIIAHRRNAYRGMILVAIGVMILSEVVFAEAGNDFVIVIIGLWLFFVGFNAIEAMLPSLISRLAPVGTKGTVLGVYNTFEFSGIFIGGLLGGAAYGTFGSSGAFVAAAGVLALWMVAMFFAPAMQLLDSITLNLPPGSIENHQELLRQLADLPGVEDSTLVAAEGLVYLKVNPGDFDVNSANGIVGISAV
ncbi:MAG: MFS transporter [marine bacterium B5-7]|nr:MAG: MFS transporter [marine bacterium B5-7]